jgi:hypothetical protein
VSGTSSPFGDALANLVPTGKRGALVVRADLEGNVTAAVATKFGDTWRVGAEFRYDPKEKKAAGYVGVEATW